MKKIDKAFYTAIVLMYAVNTLLQSYSVWVNFEDASKASVVILYLFIGLGFVVAFFWFVTRD